MALFDTICDVGPGAARAANDIPHRADWPADWPSALRPGQPLSRMHGPMPAPLDLQFMRALLLQRIDAIEAIRGVVNWQPGDLLLSAWLRAKRWDGPLLSLRTPIVLAYGRMRSERLRVWISEDVLDRPRLFGLAGHVLSLILHDARRHQLPPVATAHTLYLAQGHELRQWRCTTRISAELARLHSVAHIPPEPPDVAGDAWIDAETDRIPPLPLHTSS